MFIELDDNNLVNFDAISNIQRNTQLNETTIYLAGQLHPAITVPGTQTAVILKQLLQLKGKFVSVPEIIKREENFNKIMDFHYGEVGPAEIIQVIDKADEIITKAKESKAQLQQLSLFSDVDPSNLN